MKRSLLIAALTVVVAAAAGIIWWLVAAASGAPSPASTGTAPYLLTPTAPAVEPVDQVGQAADGGGFAPLAVPAGLPSGVGAVIADGDRTQEGAELGVGDLVVVNAYQPRAAADPYLLVVVDEITAPLTGEDRAAAFTAAGVPDDGERVVQAVTLRARQIAGGGDMSSWMLPATVQPLNGQLDAMTVVPRSGTDCGGSGAILDGHETATADTVRACLLAFGSVSAPASPVTSLAVTGRVGERTVTLYVQSNQVPDPGLEESHQEHYEGDGHDHHEDLIDPETGQLRDEQAAP